MCRFLMLQFLVLIAYIAGPNLQFRCDKRGFQSFSIRSIPMPDILLTAQRFITKLGMIVHHYELECPVKKLCCYIVEAPAITLQSHNITVCTVF